MKVNIVTVTLNSLTRGYEQVLEALYENTDKSKFHYTVVDQDSTDGTREYLRKMEKVYDFDLVCFTCNTGVSWAHNYVWRNYPGEHYVKLDPDTIMKDKDWLEKLVYVVDNSNNKIGMVGLNAENKHYKDFKIGTETVEIKDQGNVNGCCCMIPNYVNNVIGFWDVMEQPYGEEDALMGLRVRKIGKWNAYTKSQVKLVPEPKDEYRLYKDQCRSKNLKKQGEYNKKIMLYISGGSLYVK